MLSLDQHLGVWFFLPESGKTLIDHPLLFCFNTIGGFAGPLFLTLAGISAFLFLERYQESSLTMIFRGIVIIFYGYLLNVLVPCWFSYGSWFTLHMIGFGILIAPFFRKSSNSFILITCLIIILLTVVFQNMLDTPNTLWSTRMGRTDLPGGIWRLIFIEGQFPVLPWLSFFLGGMVVGKLLSIGDTKRLRILAISSYVISGLLFVSTFLKADFAIHGHLVRFFRIYLGFYPATPFFFFLLFPTVIASLLLFKLINNRWPFKSANPLICLGRSSLTIFILHIVVFKELAIRFDYFKLFSSTATPFAVLFVMALFTGLSVVWSKYDFRFGAEWFLRRIPLND